MNLILIGPQGSGKGTQGELLSKKYKLTLVEMGAKWREVAIENSERGRLINDLINQKGKLLPDGIVFELVVEYLQNLDWRNGLLFDGYPRSVVQFNLLEDYLVDRDQFLHAAIYLEIPDSIAVDRLSNRLICTKCGVIYNLKTSPPLSGNVCVCGGKLIQRIDDQPEAIKTRLRLFREVTRPLLHILKEKGILIAVDGTGSAQEVFNTINSNLAKKGLS